jgi:hypothetical protein
LGKLTKAFFLPSYYDLKYNHLKASGSRSLLTAIALISMLLYFDTNAQMHYSPGYVVLEKGDTIFGMLKQYPPEMSCQKVRIIDENGNKIRVSRAQVIAYRRGDSDFVKKRYSRPFVLGKPIGFMKLISRGEVNLYKFYYKVSGPSHNNFQDQGSNPLIYNEREKSDYYVERNGKNELVWKNSFRKGMALYFEEHTELSKKILDKELNYSDIWSIVEEFNRWYSTQN